MDIYIQLANCKVQPYLVALLLIVANSVPRDNEQRLWGKPFKTTEVGANFSGSSVKLSRI